MQLLCNNIWGKPVLDPDDMKRIRVKDLARFILKFRRFLVSEIQLRINSGDGEWTRPRSLPTRTQRRTIPN